MPEAARQRPAWPREGESTPLSSTGRSRAACRKQSPRPCQEGDDHAEHYRRNRMEPGPERRDDHAQEANGFHGVGHVPCKIPAERGLLVWLKVRVAHHEE